MFFPHDGCPAHFSGTVRDYINITFPQKRVGRCSFKSTNKIEIMEETLKEILKMIKKFLEGTKIFFKKKILRKQEG